MILDTDRIQTDALYRDEMRFRCMSDHYFLADLMGFPKFIRRLHDNAVNLYFPKNPKVSIEDQHPIKNRMHLDPRTTGKTTLGRVDSLQWILAFPETITILNESATQPLASAISQSLAQYFWTPKEKRWTVLQLLFSELTQTKAPGAVWDTPVRAMGQIDTTLAYTSPQSQQSGWHPWVINPDDMVETINSGIHATEDVRQGVIDAYNTNKNTLLAGGYNNIRGTRYHPFDLYGYLLNTMNPDKWKVLIRSSVTVKSGVRLVPGEFPDEDDLILNFHGWPGQDYETLREIFTADYESFQCQQQNDPQGGSIPTFPEKVYSAALADPDHIPTLGDTYLCWRLQYGGKPYMATHDEGACARIVNDRVYVLDCWRGIYTPTGRAERIVKAMRDYDCKSLMLEAMPGSEYMAAQIRNEALRRNISVRINWLNFEEDDHRRAGQIEQLEPLMIAGRLILAKNMHRVADARKQFLHYGLISENGIIDCISKLAEHVPMSLLRANMTEEEIEYQRRQRENEQWNQIFQQQGMAALDELERQKAEASIYAMDRINSYGMPPLPGGLDG